MRIKLFASGGASGGDDGIPTAPHKGAEENALAGVDYALNASGPAGSGQEPRYGDVLKYLGVQAPTPAPWDQQQPAEHWRAQLQAFKKAREEGHRERLAAASAQRVQHQLLLHQQQQLGVPMVPVLAVPASVPAAAVTRTTAGPSAPAGVVAVTWFSVATTLVAGTPPTVTEVAVPRYEPVIVIGVPPTKQPSTGAMPLTDAGHGPQFESSRPRSAPLMTPLPSRSAAMEYGSLVRGPQ